MIKRLAARIREYKGATILTPLCMLGEVMIEVLVPTFVAKMIDDGINKGSMPDIIRIGVILVALCGCSLLCGALSGAFCAKAGAGFAKNLRYDMFRRVQEFSFANIDKFSASSIVTRLTTDVTNVQNAFQMIIRTAVRSPAMLVFSLIMAFRINPKLSLVFLVAIPILGVGLILMMKHAFPIFERVFKKYDNLNRIVQENVRGIRVVKAFVREDHESEKFKSASEDVFSDFCKAEKTVVMNSPLMQLAVYLATILISWFGACMIIEGQGAPGAMTTGDLTGLISYTSQILFSLMMLSMVFVMITMSKASAERICEILDEESTITDPESPVTSVKDGSVRFKGVSFSYGGKNGPKSLIDVDLKVESGQTVGIIGGTGSSKSTLVQLIPRLYDVTDGSVEVGGVDVREYSLNALRDSVAMVLQKNELFSGTIKENLRWGNENATDSELEEACRLAQAHSFINDFPDGYDTYIEQGGSNVSGGQKQRLCIARALLKKPKILILDDSTSAVDTATDAEIRKGFAEYIPSTTKIIIAQRISSVRHADKIIVMDGGRIVDEGDHDSLLESCSIYREVYESQTKGDNDDE